MIEPQAFLPGYEIEIADDDATALGLVDPEDAFVLNIVNLRPDAPAAATVNLIGPIVVNRRSLLGRQVVIANFSDYSARHPLVEAQTAGI